MVKVRPSKDHCGVNLISNALPFDRLWYGEPNAIRNAVGYAKQSNSLYCSLSATSLVALLATETLPAFADGGAVDKMNLCEF